MQLTPRDIALLLDLYKYRYLSFSQLARLYFPAKPAAYRRLRMLLKDNYLKSFYTPGIHERIFYLDKAGADIVATELGVTIDDLKWYRYIRTPKDYYFLRHFLAINDFRILITQVCQDSPIQLLGFIPEYFGEKTVQGNVKKYIRDRVCDSANQSIQYSHTPDAVFALGKDDNAALFFLEIDRGLEIVSDPERGLLKSVIFYLNYWVDGKYQRYSTNFGNKPFKNFRVLYILPSNERLQHLRKTVTNFSFAKPNVKRFLWGTTSEKATKQLLFTPIWQSLDVNDATLYSIG
jgi:hypothetical protein